MSCKRLRSPSAWGWALREETAPPYRPCKVLRPSTTVAFVLWLNDAQIKSYLSGRARRSPPVTPHHVTWGPRVRSTCLHDCAGNRELGTMSDYCRRCVRGGPSFRSVRRRSVLPENVSHALRDNF
ncbi:hypothetical protein TraAM80_09110 [Trypanosoma rangeli]|uniref:Uncharacterized protein n=1 Tax=Trypanosoma rangeli TaxID=5698 RepID=A0A3R7KD07_TRYRA|nr:uncharacterized protein TraAM80_09110 [Trypanosoma rangeli]RNE98045.1 hypothetical protein TraAM80_09110 [Trypanosoma rangeli]|eukprot:RNE98045.1 hypothetical protein TraAM80_09110 [Trypanosoma rangeli]